MKKISVVLLAFMAQLVSATVTPPSGLPSYYSALDGKSGVQLFDAIHTTSKTGFSSLSYSGLWSAYGVTDLDSTGNIWDMYGGCKFILTDDQCGGDGYQTECDCYNREHSIPKSWFGGSTNTGTPGTDIFHIFPTDGKVNGTRSNYAFGEVDGFTYSYNGSLLGSGKDIYISNTILGDSYTASCYAYTVFEPIDEYKGDFARAYFGTMVRWAGDYQAFTTGDGGYIFSGNYTAAGNYGLTEYGIALLLKWHREDPVSQKEIDRNNGIQSTQGNRNPFVDYPCLAEYLWGNHYGQTLTLADIQGTFSSGYDPANPSDGCLGLPNSEVEHTIRWHILNDVDEETYNNGKPLALPAAPEACTGRVFVGWSTQSEIADPTQAPADLFQSTANMYVTADEDYYAVFATVRHELGDDYIKITSTDEFTTAKYVVVANTINYYAMKNSLKKSYYIDTTIVSVVNDVISNPGDSIIWQINVADGVASFYNEAIDKYLQLYEKDSRYYNLALTSNADSIANTYFTYEVNDGAWIFTSTMYPSYQIEYYSSKGNFSAHYNQDAPIYLFKQMDYSYEKYSTTCAIADPWPTSVEEVNAPFVIYTEDGIMHFEAQSATLVSVYNAIGVMLVQENTASLDISLPTGIYVISTPEYSQKVFIP